MAIDIDRIWQLGRLIEPLTAVQIKEFEKRFYPFCFSNELNAFYSIANGVEDIEIAETDSIESLVSSWSERDFYHQLFADDAQGLKFPPALLPFIRINGGHIFAVLCKEQRQTNVLVEWFAADGDNYMSLQYESIYGFLETKIAQRKFLDAPGSSQLKKAIEFYDGNRPLKSINEMSNQFKIELVNRALFKLQKIKNPAAFDEVFKIDGKVSKDSNNYFELDSLPEEWFE